MMTVQLGNLFALLLFIGLAVLYTSTEPKVIRNYIIALAIGDLGHLYVTYVSMGWERYWNWTAWNANAWGKIAVTAMLFAARMAYLGGLMGQDRVSVRQGKKRVSGIGPGVSEVYRDAAWKAD